MRLAKRRRATTLRFNMTPMIDIVFLLIIFFMTVSQVTKVNQEPVELPKQPGSEDQKPAVLTVNFNNDGEIIVGGTQYDLASLLALVTDELQRLNDDPTRLTIVLRADRRVASGVVNEVVEALASLDIRKVQFPVEVPQ
jgi:biopolymer transport protein ExbD